VDPGTVFWRLPTYVLKIRQYKNDKIEVSIVKCKQLLDDLKEKRGYWKLKEEALDRTLWGTGFGRM
jgi:hypothetical protein